MKIEEKDYVTFETAELALKKGFTLIQRPYFTKSGMLVKDSIIGPCIPAPFKFQLQKWLREEYEINVEPICWNKNKYQLYIYSSTGRKQYYDNGCSIFDSYEQALEVGLFEALNLIK